MSQVVFWIGVVGISFLRGYFDVPAAEQAPATAITKDHQEVRSFTGLLDLKPGTSAETVFRKFGKPDSLGELRPSSDGAHYLDIWLIMHGQGPWVSGDVTWVYSLENGKGFAPMGHCYFILFKEKKVVRAFRGELNGAGCD